MFAKIKDDFKAWGEYQRLPADDIYHGGSGKTIEASIMESKPPRRKKQKTVNAYSKKYYCSKCDAPLKNRTCSIHGYDPKARSFQTFAAQLPKSTSGITPRHNREPSAAVKRIERVMSILESDPELFILHQVGCHKYWYEDENNPAAKKIGVSEGTYRRLLGLLHSTATGLLYEAPKALAG